MDTVDVRAPSLDTAPGQLLDATTTASQPSAAWLRVRVAVAAVLALYTPVVPGLVREWTEFPNLSHGFAIPFIAGYLAWARREMLAGTRFEPALAGALVLTAGLFVYAVGVLGGETFIARVALPTMLFGTVSLLGGWAVAWQLAPAIGYLVLMVPFPYLPLRFLTDESRMFDATVTAAVLPWLGIPVNQTGFLLHLPHITLEVADACSSVPATLSLVALGVSYGFLGERSNRARVALALLAVPLGIASNIARIVLTAVAAHLLGLIALHNVIHKFSGTTVFLMTLGALILLDCLLRRFWPAR
jgi:exosortase